MSKDYASLTRVQIRNFQSIEDADADLGRLTVLVGPGDAGKSAFLRALRATFLNEGGDDDIRHGAKKAEVALTFEDGTVIEWWKEQGKGGCYRMGWAGNTTHTKEFTKTGGAVPDAIAEYLGIGRIEVDATTELTPQLSDQHDAPFILWETGSKRARIIGKATRLDMVVSAQMLCKKELDKTRRDAGEATNALAQVEERLALLPDYEALEGRLGETEENLKTIEDGLVRANRARELADQIAEARSRATAVDVSGLKSTLVVATRDLNDAARLHELAEAFSEVRLRIEAAQAQKRKTGTTLKEAQEAYQSTCEEAGLCLVCGGLLTHEECGG